MTPPPPADPAEADAPPDDDGPPPAHEGALSGVATCGARRRGRSCALEVLHAGDHHDGHPNGDTAGDRRGWRRGRREQRRRDALAGTVERLREAVARPLDA